MGSGLWGVANELLPFSVIVSQLHCLIPHFSSKAVIGMFLFGPLHGIGYLCSPCFERPVEGRHEKAKGRWELTLACQQPGPAWAELQLRVLVAYCPGIRWPRETLRVEGQVAVSVVS